MDQTERDLVAQAARLNTREEFLVWEERCDNFIKSLEEQSRAKRPRLSISVKQLLIAHTARLENLNDTVRGHFVQVGVEYSAGFRWREIDTFKSRILIGAVINSGHIELRQFLDAREIVLENVMQRNDNIKINSV